MLMERASLGKTALVTGGSSGIGLEIAKLLAADGYSLVLVARSKPDLQRVAKGLSIAYGVSVLALSSDLSRPDAPQEIYSQLNKKGITVDVLVNNAGFGQFGTFIELDEKTQLEMIEVNITALTKLTKLFLPQMVQRGRGRVLNLASTAAFQPGPLMAVYYASKAYVLSFSQAIGNELAGTGVTVTALCPGPTGTGFATRAGLRQSKLFSALSVSTSKDVAVAGYRAMLKGEPVVIVGFKNKALNFLQRFLPRETVVNYVRRMQEERT
jgi:short-subunit dehydrogenase